MAERTDCTVCEVPAERIMEQAKAEAATERKADKKPDIEPINESGI